MDAFLGVDAGPKTPVKSLFSGQPSTEVSPVVAATTLARLFRERILGCTEQSRRCQDAAQRRLDALRSACPGSALRVEGALHPGPLAFLQPDEEGSARLRRLDSCLGMIAASFPQVGTDIEICRLTCTMLEGAWRTRALSTAIGREQATPCSCRFCRRLLSPPARTLGDYRWRQSDGRPLTVKTWPYRQELDSVLTGGWSWTRQMNDLERDLGLRHRFEDDILVFHEYKRVIDTIDITHLSQLIEARLAETFSLNGARALVCGLFAAHKRSVDQYWLRRHRSGSVKLPQSNPLDQSTYALLQMLDCLFWHVPPDTELWQEEQLACLLLSRVIDDMADVRADALTGEISNFWLTEMPTHTKALYAACAIARVKYGCMPEAHASMWNTWLMSTTIVWMGLTGRHALWFDGLTQGLEPAQECPLCDLQPSACTGVLTRGTTLTISPRATIATVSPRTAELSRRCQIQCPEAWPLFDAELHAFEALHGPWDGNVDSTWTILRRTYIAAVEASRVASSLARAQRVQQDAGAVGAEQFHTLHEPRTGREDTTLLAYMFACAHPHFLWNAMGCRPATVIGDWLDG